MDINSYILSMLQVKKEAAPPYIGRRKNTTRESVLTEIFTNLGYTVGAEIGVQRGYFSKAMLENVPNLKMYCVDPWEPYTNVRDANRQERHYEICKANLSGLNAEIIRKTSHDALDDFKDGSLDFVYIDGLHDFDNVMFDIMHWARKVKVGGIVSGHDYFYYHGVGVIFAVEAYTRAHHIIHYYITKEYPPSWFWPKL